MKKKEENKKIDTRKIKYAHLVRFVDDDIIKNQLPNMQLRCTHLSYVVGDLNSNGTEFIDMMCENEKYLYFKSVTDAICYFGDETIQTPFTLKANPIEYLGIKECLTKAEIKQRIKRLGMYFNFIDEENEKTKKLKY